MNIFVKLALTYFENHPEQVEKLAVALVDALIQHLHKPANA